jgi:hypothetical protein
VVHRDVKPANVMLIDGNPVLIDFGIAHVVDESRITRAGLVMGTPGYLSPELIYGEAVTPAADWWAWAATLAFAATGRQPFGSGPVEVVLDRVRRGRSDLEGVEDGLRDLLAATFTVDPDRRPSAAVLLSRLDDVISGVSTTPFRVDRSGRPAPRPHDRPSRPASAPAGPTSWSDPPIGATARMPPPVEADGTAIPPYPGVLRAGRQLPHVQAPRPQPPHPRQTAVWGGPGPGQPDRLSPQAEATRPEPVPSAGQAYGAPARVTGTLAALAVAVAVVAAVAPGGAIVIAFCWSALARLVHRSSTGLQRRRQELGGARATDVAVTVAALPWRLLMSLTMSAVSLVLPLLVATSIVFVADAGTSLDGVPRLSGTSVLFAAMLSATAAAWWGPGGRSLRSGSRDLVRAVTRGRGGRRAVVWLCVLVVAAGMIVSDRAGGARDWAPFPPPRSLIDGS